MTSKIIWSTVEIRIMAVSLMTSQIKKIEGKLICNKQKLVELFNEHYINIVEKYPGKKPLSLANC